MNIEQTKSNSIQKNHNFDIDLQSSTVHKSINETPQGLETIEHDQTPNISPNVFHLPQRETEQFDLRTGYINKFVILGERCSGTNLLKMLMETNFDCEYSIDYHHKHFFGHFDYDSKIDELPQTIFLCVVRNFYEWVLSFYNKQHHLKRVSNLQEFLCQEIHSFDENENEIQQDMNFETLEPYKNIFDLRKTKCCFMLDTLPKKVHHYYYINYENICNSLQQVNFLEKLASLFPLNKKNHMFTSISFNAQIYNHSNVKKLFSPQKYFFYDSKILEYIDANLDVALEKRLGYDVEFYKKKLDFNKKSSLNQYELQKEMIQKRNKMLLDTKILSKMKETSNEASNNSNNPTTNNISNSNQKNNVTQNDIQTDVLKNAYNLSHISRENSNFADVTQRKDISRKRLIKSKISDDKNETLMNSKSKSNSVNNNFNFAPPPVALAIAKTLAEPTLHGPAPPRPPSLDSKLTHAQGAPKTLQKKNLVPMKKK